MHFYNFLMFDRRIKTKNATKPKVIGRKKPRVKTGYNALSRFTSLLGFCCKDVTTMTENTIEVRVLPVPVESMLYYYGSISRETAEWILWDRGCKDGMYLLRESNSDYVLSLCYQSSVLHYRIKKLSSGEVGLCGVPRQKFAGPVELVQGVEGLACKPTLPCNKSLDSVLPLTHWGVTEEAIRKAILKKARDWGIQDDKLDSSLTENYNDIKILITKTLHEIQPWFHGHLSRVQAEQHIEESGHKDGKFLVRSRDDSSYALCLSHSGRIKHYKIDVLPSGEFAIQDGQRFSSIMALVSHYTLFSDGLWCCLQDPCVVPPRRSSENASQPRNRNNALQNAGSHHNTLERNKNDSDGGLPSSKASRFLMSLNQRKIFSKLFSTVAPQFASQTLPQHSSRHGALSSQSRTSLYPSLSDDNLESADLCVQVSPELNRATHPSTPPSSMRKGSLSSSKRASLHKASSFDFLPAFLSLFLYGEKKIDHHVTKDNICNGDSQTAAKTAPIPAPRLSLAKKESGPVYANREALANTGRSISLGENATYSVGKEALFQNDFALFQPVIRSASSPSVVSHSKLHSHLLPRLSASEGATISVSNDSHWTALTHKSLGATHPVPKPRKKFPFQLDTSCESCASTDGSTSPTLTERSEFGLELNCEDSSLADCLEDLMQCVQESSGMPDEGIPHAASNSHEDSQLNPAMALPAENSVYATLSASSNVLCLLSNDVQSSTTSNNCPEGILIDLDPPSKLSIEESELAYLTLREWRCGALNLDQKTIQLKEKIGSSVFCDVFRGVFSSGLVEVQFAIKILKSSCVPNSKNDIVKEAHTMSMLDHPHIARLIGVCESSCFMLVTELAPLGPLNKYLQAHRDLSVSTILMLMLQVVSAMEYLESKQYVHRDLAARNVLLVNESFVKISDFGMSRALGLGKEYYRAESAGKWPLKWYAPECIYYFRFSSKSDVWSFGVTLWECLSYGEKPYKGMVGHEILQMFECNERLEQPESCPDCVYSLMRKCWEYKAEDRPSFSQVKEIIQDCIP